MFRENNGQFHTMEMVCWCICAPDRELKILADIPEMFYRDKIQRCVYQ